MTCTEYMTLCIMILWGWDHVEDSYAVVNCKKDYAISNKDT